MDIARMEVSAGSTDRMANNLNPILMINAH